MFRRSCLLSYGSPASGHIKLILIPFMVLAKYC